MAIPSWWKKAGVKAKEQAIRRLNKELGAVSLGVVTLPELRGYEKYKRGLLSGDALQAFLQDARKTWQPIQESHEQLAMIEKWRNGDANLPPDVRRCRYKKCSKFFLFREGWRNRSYCSRACGRNYRSSKSMNRRNQKLREDKLKRVRIALRKVRNNPDWKERTALAAQVTKNFVSYAVRRGELSGR